MVEVHMAAALRLLEACILARMAVVRMVKSIRNIDRGVGVLMVVRLRVLAQAIVVIRSMRRDEGMIPEGEDIESRNWDWGLH